MIITCSECSTSFNLDDSLIKGNGSKVRCSVCKNIFTVYPLPQEPEQADGAAPDFIPEEDPDFEDASDFDMGDTDFSLKDSELDIESQDLVLEDSEFTAQDLEQKDNEFSFEENEFELNTGDEQTESEEKEFEFETKDISEDITIDTDENKDNDFDGIEFEPMKDESEEPGLSMEEGEADFKIDDDTDLLDTDFYETSSHEEKKGPEEEKAKNSETGEETGEEGEFELEFDVDDDLTDSLSDAPDPNTYESPLEMMQESENKEETLTLERDEPEEELAEIPPEDDFSDYDTVLEQKTELEDNLDDEEPVGKDTDKEETIEEKPLVEESIPLMDSPERRSIRKKKPMASLPVLMLLLIFLLVAGVYVASIMTGYKIPYLPDAKIPFIEKYLKKTVPVATNTKPVPNENSVNGRFVSNSAVGALFVITGRVDNPSSLSFSHIEVQGALSTKEIPVAKTKNTFCGNIITEEMLKSGDIAEISKLLEIKEGNHNSNVNIKPGASVPFMVVFSDLPENLQNFNVKVVGFEKASGN